MLLDVGILILMIIAALWTVMARSLIRAAIGLALTSAILTIVMFRLGSPLAAVFELSVCAGLISVLFVSTISLTDPLTAQEKVQATKDKLHKFKYLIFIIIALGIFFILSRVRLNLTLPPAHSNEDARVVLWHFRHLDLLGQIIILLTGVFGVVILFKERQK